MNLWQVFLHTGYVGKCVVLILLVLSLQSWYIIISNYFRYNSFQELLEEVSEALTQVKTFPSLIKFVKNMETHLIGYALKKIIALFGDIYEYYFENLKNSGKLDMDLSIKLAEKELEEAIEIEKEKLVMKMERGLGFLATVGNVAPFIGLFGTVWGIMQAFHEIGIKGSASLATVAPGIAEALINTAMGLFCAIPAVIAYNYYLLKKEKLSKNLDLLLKKTFLILKKGFTTDFK